jgi:hypothetical protein
VLASTKTMSEVKAMQDFHKLMTVEPDRAFDTATST